MEASELELVPPESIRLGANTVRCGGTVYRAVKCVLNADGGRSLRAFCRDVWGREVSQVKRETIRSAVHRANKLLEGLAYHRRLLLDGDRVTVA